MYRSSTIRPDCRINAQARSKDSSSFHPALLTWVNVLSMTPNAMRLSGVKPCGSYQRRNPGTVRWLPALAKPTILLEQRDYSSTIATARIGEAVAPLSFIGRAETVKPKGLGI